MQLKQLISPLAHFSILATYGVAVTREEAVMPWGSAPTAGAVSVSGAILALIVVFALARYTDTPLSTRVSVMPALRHLLVLGTWLMLYNGCVQMFVSWLEPSVVATGVGFVLVVQLTVLFLYRHLRSAQHRSA